MSYLRSSSRLVISCLMPLGVLCGSSLAALPAAAAPAHAYVSNFSTSSVSVVDTKTNKIIGSPIPVGDSPLYLTVTPNGKVVYVANVFAPSVSVIDSQTNTVVAAVQVTSGGAIENSLLTTPN